MTLMETKKTMSDSIKKYEELVEDGKIKPGKLSDTLLSKKEKNVIDLISLCRTTIKHDLDFEITVSAIEALHENPKLTEIEAIRIGMNEWDIL